MSSALRRLGFEVTTEFDADLVELTEALRAFTRRSAGADVSWCSTRATASRWTASTTWCRSTRAWSGTSTCGFETVTVDDLLVSTSGASLRLVILDACRNNPLARSMQAYRSDPYGERGSFADLNEGPAGRRDAGGVCGGGGNDGADGRGRNSPYTAGLLSHLQTPLEIGMLFRRVRAQVLAATNGAQRPHGVPLAGGRALPGRGRWPRAPRSR